MARGLSEDVPENGDGRGQRPRAKPATVVDVPQRRSDLPKSPQDEPPVYPKIDVPELKAKRDFGFYLWLTLLFLIGLAIGVTWVKRDEVLAFFREEEPPASSNVVASGPMDPAMIVDTDDHLAAADAEELPNIDVSIPNDPKPESTGPSPEELARAEHLQTIESLTKAGDFAEAIESALDLEPPNENERQNQRITVGEILRLWNEAAEVPNSENQHLLTKLANDGFGEDVRPILKRGSDSAEAEDLSWDEALALTGDSAAMLRLGIAMETTKKNLAGALPWYRRAADLGEIEAAYRFGECRVLGKGTEPNPAEGVAYLRQAADGSDERAMDLLGVCYVRGLGVEMNPAEAVSWFRKAVDAGSVPALYNLGARFAQGQGVDTDPAEAAILFKRGADLGNAVCMATYAKCLESAFGVELDEAGARAWYIKAATAGNPTAVAWCEANEVPLPPKSLTETQTN